MQIIFGLDAKRGSASSKATLPRFSQTF